MSLIQAPRTVALIGAFDTKGVEYSFVKKCIEANGLRTFTIDTGVLDEPAFAPDVTRAEVAKAGGADLDDLIAKKDRGTAIAAMARGAETLLPKFYAAKKFDGVMALGGGSGTSMSCAAMRALPLGVPKVMVSTVAGTDVSHYVGGKDIVMIPSIVDIAGINRISREILSRAAGAVCGMVETNVAPGDDKPLILASMFGNTTKCVEHARGILENAGYEVLIFHATGTGGKTLESLVVPVDENLIVHLDWSSNRMQTAFDHLYNLKEPPTALFTTNDYIAYEFMDYAASRGIQVPRDLSVVGHGNIDKYVPRTFLTSVDQPFELIGKAAAKLLLRRLSDMPYSLGTCQQMILQSSLIVRDSCRRLHD